MSEGYEVIRSRIESFSREVYERLSRYVEMHKELEDVVQRMWHNFSKSLEFIEKCDLGVAAIYAGYFATEVERFYSISKDPTLSGSLAALYIILCLLIGESVNRCAKCDY